MATISFQYIIPDDKLIEVLDAVTNYLGYQAIIDGAPNPQTRKRFLDESIRGVLKAWYTSEKAKAGEVVRLQAIVDADAVSITTG